MTLRILEGELKKDYYARTGEPPEAPSARYEQIVKDASVGPQKRNLSRCMVEEGSDPINVNQAVNGSITPVRFSTPVPSDEIWIISQLIFLIRDTGDFDVGGWGNSQLSELTNGVKLGLVIDGVDYSISDGTWRSHIDLGNTSFHVNYQNFGLGDSFLHMRLNFDEMGTKIRLDGSKGDKMYLDIQDDLTVIVYQHGMAQGHIENKLIS